MKAPDCPGCGAAWYKSKGISSTRVYWEFTCGSSYEYDLAGVMQRGITFCNVLDSSYAPAIAALQSPAPSTKPETCRADCLWGDGSAPLRWEAGVYVDCQDCPARKGDGSK